MARPSYIVLLEKGLALLLSKYVLCFNIFRLWYSKTMFRHQRCCWRIRVNWYKRWFKIGYFLIMLLSHKTLHARIRYAKIVSMSNIIIFLPNGDLSHNDNITVLKADYFYFPCIVEKFNENDWKEIKTKDMIVFNKCYLSDHNFHFNSLQFIEYER